VVVIGHVDHGKTALVRALTSTETDRLPEEKARCLSITPGYAHLQVEAGTVDLIDAPGHEDFIPAMVSGASGAQAALVVISAIDGVGAQTLEHLRIAQLLGITTGLTAVTKADLLADDDRPARLDAIRHSLRHTAFADLAPVWCSAISGEGIDAVRDGLGAVIAKDRTAPTPQHSYLPIDRIFTLEGRGTVVTGTLLGHDLSCADEATVLPEGRSVSIRGLQSRGMAREHIQPGERMAVNLRGVAVADIARGSVLCTGSDSSPSRCMDVALDVLPDCSRPLKHDTQLRVLFGTSSEVAHVRLFGGGQFAAGQSGFAQLRFNRPVVGFAGQRAVLRRLSPAETLGGAVFLDPQAKPTRAGDAPRLKVLEAVQQQDLAAVTHALAQGHGGVFALRVLARLMRRPDVEVAGALGPTFALVGDGLMAAQPDIEATKAKIAEALRGFHAQNPLKLAAPRPVLEHKGTQPALLEHAKALAVEEGLVRRHGTLLALTEHDPLAALTPQQAARLAEMEEVFRTAELEPPSAEAVARDGVDEALLALLKDLGRLVALVNIALKQTLVFHRDALAAAATGLGAAFPEPVEFTTSQARTALATSRRIIVPVLEYFDAQGLCIRHGDARRMAAAFAVPPGEAN
jgi:selenocysteine-specific elongation factor